MEVDRDPGCGCCEAWVQRLEATGRFQVDLRSAPDMPAVKAALGVPIDLASCHTAQVRGLVVEGHVPAEDILRMLDDRPLDVVGLAVPGMPLGSPGMEQPGMGSEPFDVIAFRRDGSRYVYASYPGA